MTWNVYIKPKTKEYKEWLKVNYAKIDKNFRKIHKQKFKNLEEKIHIVKHGIDFINNEDKDYFLSIPCHWSYLHTMRTIKDIETILKKENKLEGFDIESSF